jgi:hypothetical protein
VRMRSVVHDVSGVGVALSTTARLTNPQDANFRYDSKCPSGDSASRHYKRPFCAARGAQKAFAYDCERLCGLCAIADNMVLPAEREAPLGGHNLGGAVVDKLGCLICAAFDEICHPLRIKHDPEKGELDKSSFAIQNKVDRTYPDGSTKLAKLHHDSIGELVNLIMKVSKL